METKLFWIRVENTKTGIKHPSGFAPCDHETACRLLKKMSSGPDRRNFLEELDEREMELFDFDIEWALNRGEVCLHALVRNTEYGRCTAEAPIPEPYETIKHRVGFLRRQYPKRVEA